jgi:hypothetical protein
MKLTSGLSTVALVLLVNTAPCFALNQSSQDLSKQPLSSQGEDIKVAGLFETIDKTIDTVERERKRRSRARERRLRRQRAAERRRARELRAAEQQRVRELRQQQMQERALARQRQQEANRQRFAKWWETLSPQEKQAYRARKHAQQKKIIEFWIPRLGAALVESMMNPGSGASSTNSGYTHRYENRNTGGYRPAPRPVTPVGGSRGFYGSGPQHGTSTPRY